MPEDLTVLNAVHRAITRAAFCCAAVTAASVFAVGATSAACIAFITAPSDVLTPHNVSVAKQRLGRPGRHRHRRHLPGLPFRRSRGRRPFERRRLPIERGERLCRRPCVASLASCWRMAPRLVAAIRASAARVVHRARRAHRPAAS